MIMIICGEPMKCVVLGLFLCVTVGSAVVLNSNQYFDRILSSFGQEVTFYGLGLNISRTNIPTQIIVKHLADCKNIFRVVPSCVTAFAEKLDNGTVLCIYTHHHIYHLPTIRKEKGKAFAFYKEPELIPSSDNYGNWTSLQDNGIFYAYRSVHGNNVAESICYNESFPNGYILRLTTSEDLDIFWKVIPILPNLCPKYIPIDLIYDGGQHVNRDGTLLNPTIVAGSIDAQNNFYITIPCFESKIYFSTSQYLKVYVICQINPFLN